VSLSVYPPTIGRQRLGKHIPGAKKIHWRHHFLMQSVSYQGKVGDQFFPELLVNVLKFSQTPKNSEGTGACGHMVGNLYFKVCNFLGFYFSTRNI
jgi:hypothetical protein